MKSLGWMIDLRNDLAKARDAWMASDEGTRIMQGNAAGQYLAHRLEVAFVAGWKAHERITRAVMVLLAEIDAEPPAKHEPAISVQIGRYQVADEIRAILAAPALGTWP